MTPGSGPCQRDDNSRPRCTRRADSDPGSGANGAGGAFDGPALEFQGEASSGAGADRERWRVQETYLPLPPVPQLCLSADPRLVRLKTHSRFPLIALHPLAVEPHPPAVAKNPGVFTPARQSGIRHPAHFNCGARKPSRRKLPLKTNVY